MTDRIDRRLFFKSGAAVAAGLSAGARARGMAEEPRDANSHLEPARTVPIVEHDDVIVCGAGPAGMAAAIAAARSGARTRLIEVNGCLGGVWTAGLLSWILDSAHKTGLMRTLLAKLEDRHASAVYGTSVGYDVEQMKLVLESLCLEAGVSIRLHTRVAAAGVNDSGRLDRVLTESKSGREAWSADVFVDATGDGDLAALAGCGFDYGRPGTGQAQPMSFIVLLAGIEPDGVAPFVRGLAEPRNLGSPKANLLEEMRRAGCDPSYAQPTLFYIRQGLFCLMANHQYGVAGTDAGQLTEASLRGRAEVHRLVDGLRGLGGVWKNVQIIATPEHIGVREGRRIHGLYQVTAEDLVEGARHEDAVCEVRFGVDVHSTDPQKSKGIPGQGVRAKPYEIPYRALIARDVQGLLMAGRCISGDFIAHSSYRVTGDAVPLGEAAGAAAAIAAEKKCLPQEVPWHQIRQAIESAGA